MRNILLSGPTLSTSNISSVDLCKRFGKPRSITIRRRDGGAVEPHAPPHAIFPMSHNMLGHHLQDPRIIIFDYGIFFLIKQTLSLTLYTPGLDCPPEALFADTILLPMAADIWTIGLALYGVLWERPLFETFGWDRDDIIGEMVNTLGPLPKPCWDRWSFRYELFTADGQSCV